MNTVLAKSVFVGALLSGVGFGIHILATMLVNLKAPPKPFLEEPVFVIALITLIVMYAGAALAAIGLIGFVSKRRLNEARHFVWLACGAFVGPAFLTAVYGGLAIIDGLPSF